MRVYDIPIKAVTPAGSGAYDILELIAATGKPLTIEEIIIDPCGTAGTPAYYQIDMIEYNGTLAGGTASGTSVTPQKTLQGDAAASFTAYTANTSNTSGTTTINHPSMLMNNQIGCAWQPLRDGQQITIQGGNALVLRPSSLAAMNFAINGRVRVSENF